MLLFIYSIFGGTFMSENNSDHSMFVGCIGFFTILSLFSALLIGSTLYLNMLPVTKAGPILRAIRKKGKFHGKMPAITPKGRLNNKIFSTRKTSSPSKTTAASFRPTPLPWRAQSNISASRATS